MFTCKCSDIYMEAANEWNDEQISVHTADRNRSHIYFSNNLE